eukprot:m.105486 g.105486  ORF g.105486 m.105486 type:complete len:59 (+) comp14196_c0_seq2:120-296(+)
MPGYCEKSDVWKLPFVLEHFMQDPPPWVRRAVNERVSFDSSTLSPPTLTLTLNLPHPH